MTIPARPKPIGVNEPLETDRQPIWRIYNGDDIVLRLRVQVPGTAIPVDPDNSILVFVLSYQRFTPQVDKIWEGRWRAGIQEVDHADHPGLIEVRVPPDISADLRRGSLLYSLVATNKLGEHRSTVVEGVILVEYAPTTPIHDIPYKPEETAG